MGDNREDRLDREALAIMAAATVVDLKREAEELSELWAELDEDRREKMLVLLFGPKLEPLSSG
ncbi:hypothetical protein [Bradyrhizobium japonicum]|jgi:hypothetical protein|uniref:hypothetical protein n=1 Tax=Bradyrhizobium japonicum TaxID=375 RepID=UPI00209E13DE|nr:hypothetical protein [Bradyrhizobium japonicum]MCP1765156.1 hypothetical protein [Bradyrhizobium japonicum]MCP1787293.1 hypothetical protein [Bradyrhizobium japonicum]MCP1809170.1 hypothetical protein [Bradyrhizobium japonicum]MCP1818103.1 hypothetical protein [Bradyrhizobium japonicum]MCP1870388.1 hypothetical protein [Bradyrhizobium japonicum]